MKKLNVVHSVLFASWLASCGGAGSSASLVGGPGASLTGVGAQGNLAPAETLQALCPSSPANAVFNNAVCVCEDFQDVGQSILLESAEGSSATFAVNGKSNITGLMTLNGSLVSYQGLFGTGQLHVRDSVTSNGDVQGVGQLTVGNDLTVGGDLMSVGALSVGGTMRVAGQTNLVGYSQNVAAVAPFVSVGAAPCGCDPSTFFNVKNAVANAKATNDNAAAGLQSLDVVGKQDVTLKTGTYYFANVQSVGQTKITIEGAVALYLDGDLETVGNDQISLTPGSVLDLYVSGNVRSVGHTQIATDGAPGAFRLYVGGNDAVEVQSSGQLLSVGQQSIRGMIYAPEADLTFVGNTNIEGAIFARKLNGVGQFKINAASVSNPSTDFCEGSTGGSSVADGGVIYL